MWLHLSCYLKLELASITFLRTLKILAQKSLLQLASVFFSTMLWEFISIQHWIIVLQFVAFLKKKTTNVSVSTCYSVSKVICLSLWRVHLIFLVCLQQVYFLRTSFCLNSLMLSTCALAYMYSCSYTYARNAYGHRGGIAVLYAG